MGVKRDSNYKISDISLEYEIITQPNLARHITMEYQSMALLYDRVLRFRQIPVNKLDTMWNWSCYPIQAGHIVPPPSPKGFCLAVLKRFAVG